MDPNKEILLDVSSTSSDSDTAYLTPLTELRKKELLDKEKVAAKTSKSKKSKKSKKNKKSKKHHKSGSKRKRKR